MRDELLLDGHKLHLHPQRVADFLAGRPVYPIYTEVSLTNRCNLSCRFCALEYRQGEVRDLELPRLLTLIDEFAAVGVKSICFAGEGEPLLYAGLPEVLARCTERGIDSAVATNGTALTEDLAPVLVRHLTWIKISLNAIRTETYCHIHRGTASDLDRVRRGIARLVAARRAIGSAVAIGVQAVLLPENAGEMVEMAVALREMGVDYFVVKPFNDNRHSGNTEYRDIDYRPYLALHERLRQEATGTFAVHFRLGAMTKVIMRERNHAACHGVNFFALVYSDGRVYTCAPHSGDDDYCYGNIIHGGFREVWDSAVRRDICRRLQQGLEHCPAGCRLDEINRYLWELLHPARHVNFI